MDFINLADVQARNELFYWCNSLGEINMPGDGGQLITHQPDELPPAVRQIYEKYWNDWDLSMYVATYQGNTGIALCYLFDDDWKNNLHISTPELKEYCQKFFSSLHLMGLQNNAPLVSNKLSSYRFLFGKNTDPNGDELLVFVPQESLDSLPGLQICLSTQAGDLYHVIAQRVEQERFDRYLQIADMCETCSEVCTFADEGICKYPFIHGKKPIVDQDGCKARIE